MHNVFMHFLFDAVKGTIINILLVSCWDMAMEESSEGKQGKGDFVTQ